MVWLPAFGIFNVHTAIDTCDCTRGLYRHCKRGCTGSWLWEKNPLPHLGLKPASILRLGFSVGHSTNWAIPSAVYWDEQVLSDDDDGTLFSFQERSSSASSSHASRLQAISGVMSLALYPQVVSQAPQHFRSSEKQAACESCFAHQSVCLVISLHSSMSRAVATVGGDGDVFRMTVPAVFLLTVQKSLCWWWWRWWCFQNDCSGSFFVGCSAVFVFGDSDVFRMTVPAVFLLTARQSLWWWWWRWWWWWWRWWCFQDYCSGSFFVDCTAVFVVMVMVMEMVMFSGLLFRQSFCWL